MGALVFVLRLQCPLTSAIRKDGRLGASSRCFMPFLMKYTRGLRGPGVLSDEDPRPGTPGNHLSDATCIASKQLLTLLDPCQETWLPQPVLRRAAPSLLQTEPPEEHLEGAAGKWLLWSPAGSLILQG